MKFEQNKLYRDFGGTGPYRFIGKLSDGRLVFEEPSGSPTTRLECGSHHRIRNSPLDIVGEYKPLPTDAELADSMWVIEENGLHFTYNVDDEKWRAHGATGVTGWYFCGDTLHEAVQKWKNSSVNEC